MLENIFKTTPESVNEVVEKAQKQLAKKQEVKQEVKIEPEVCSNCENSGLTCIVCGFNR